MRYLGRILLGLLIFISAFLFHTTSIFAPTFFDPDAPEGEIPGTADDPFAASRYRFEMLGGSQPGVDLRQMHRDALHQASALVSHALQKTTANTWVPIGPGNIGGRIRAIAIHPTNPLNMLIGAVAGGIWKSTDGGLSWSPKTDDINPIAIGCLLIDPTNPNTVYAGTGEGWGNVDASYGGGILKSTDFGESWSFLSSTIGGNVLNFNNVMKMAADQNGILYAITKASEWPGGYYDTNGGLFRSADKGSSWSKISGGVTADYNPCDVICVDANTTVFAVNGGGVYRTTNAGTNWTPATGLPSSGLGRISLAQTPSTPSTLYACVANSSNNLSGMYGSTDGGSTWSLLTNSISDNSTNGTNILGGQGWYDNVIAVDPFDATKIYAGGVNIFKSTNSGVGWTRTTVWDGSFGTPVIHADQHAIVFHPSTANTIFVGNDGGLWKTTDAGTSWTSLNNGLQITQFYGGATYATGSTSYGGTQDNGHLKFEGGTSWSMTYGGDGGYAAQDQTNSNVAYEEYVYLAMSKTTNAGTSWSSCFSHSGGSALFISPFAMDPINSSVLVAGSDLMYLTSDAAATWTAVSASNTSYPLCAVTITGANSPYLAFGGRTDGTIYRCTNLTAASGTSNTWTDISPSGRKGTYVRRVVVDPSNANRLFACYSGYNTNAPLQSKHLWMSTNQGTSWTDISLTLPNTPVHSLVIDPLNSSVLYAGTETGVFTSPDNGSTWTSFATGMPTYVPVDELVLQSGTGKLFAFTHGRSAFATVNMLPVQISSFAATLDQGSVRLEWNTVSEIDNYGFEVDHSSDPLSGFTTIPRLFIPGHGTTNAPQSYSATCTVPAGQSYFRLRQIDRSGTVHFSTTVGLTVATSAPSQVPPGHFGISSNYPNPFNPSTIIAFAISAPGHVKLEVFDVTGKRVATLTDGPREAGSFSIRFDASGLSSGLYIARLASGKNVSVQKMLLTK